MAKEKDDVTPEVTNPNSPPATTRPGFTTHVTDAPDHPGASTPSQRVQEEQAAGREAIRSVSGSPAALGGLIAANPADRDPAHAAEVAIAMNAEHEEHDRWVADKRFLPEGETDPGEVPSRGYPQDPLPGEEFTQGTASYRTSDPRLTDPDTELGKRVEGLKQSREAEEARVKETVARANHGSGGNDPAGGYKEKMAQQRDKSKK